MPIKISNEVKYHIITFGCQMNKSDSERIGWVLEKIGCQATDKISSADLIIINMCSVRQSAVDRVYGLIEKIKPGKQKIILTGCILPPDKRKMENRVDLIFDIRNLSKLPFLLKLVKSENKFANYLSLSPLRASTFSAYVPVMTGCNNFCAYCVVPYTRGKEISRPVKEIIKEIKCLIKKGYKEIILLGQNVNSYQGKIKNQKSKNLKMEKYVDFADLLGLIDNLPDNFWLTFITSHPKDLSDKLIKVMASGKKIMPYLHLPVQSGDNEILKKMNRGYTVKDYKNLVRKIRDKIKTINISTDIIVGFPGETKNQFNNTIKLMKWAKFDMVYIARYSPRPGTVAANLKDNISSEEKKEREKILTDILKKTALGNNKKYINKTIEILIEKRIKDNSFLGKTKTFKNVKIQLPRSTKSSKGQKALDRFLKIGRFYKCQINEANVWGLKGKFKTLRKNS